MLTDVTDASLDSSVMIRWISISIKQILDLVREHELSEFEIEHDGLRLKVRKDAPRPRRRAPPCRAAARRAGAGRAARLPRRAAGAAGVAEPPRPTTRTKSSSPS